MGITTSSSIQSGYENWRVRRLSQVCHEDARLSLLVKDLTLPLAVSALASQAPLLTQLRATAKQMQLPSWQRILFRIAEFVLRWLDQSYAQFYQNCLVYDLKGRNVEKLIDWMSRDNLPPLAKDVATHQLYNLVHLRGDGEALEKLYQELSFSREVIETHEELTQLTHMPKERAQYLSISSNLARRLGELMGRSGNSSWQSYLQHSPFMTPGLWSRLHAPTPEGKTLMEYLVEEEAFFLSKVRSKFAPHLCSNQSEEASKKVGELPFISLPSNSPWVPSVDIQGSEAAKGTPFKIAPVKADFLPKSDLKSAPKLAPKLAPKSEEADFHSVIAAYYGDEGVIDASLDRAIGVSSQSLKPGKPLRITHVGVEYGWLWKQGGLGEAIAGLVEAEKKLNSNHSVRMVFPYYNTLKGVVASLDDVKITEHKASSGSYKTHEFTKDGIEFVLIEHESFQLDAKTPSIYTSDHKMRHRFATFCDLSADWIRNRDEQPDVLHLHDWHVASVVESIRKNSQSDWKEGKTPAVVFTFHNNARPAQGRAVNGDQAGAYAYGIGVNPMVTALRYSDMVTTVSPSFSLEVQTPTFSEGLHTAMQVTAAQRRLVGILNGINMHNYDPSRDEQLKAWRLTEHSEAFDLTYTAQSTAQELAAKQKQAKVCFANWIEQQRKLEHPGGQLLGRIDPERPILFFIGRYDTAQKGIDDFESIIETALKNNCQIAFIGSQEDGEAKLILDDLQAKYKQKNGVVILRDYRLNGHYRYQEGSSFNAPVRSLLRAASDLMIVPSHFEPCGLVQFESFAYGKPVIARARGGLVDTIKPVSDSASRFTGWLFEDGDGRSDSMRAQLTQAVKFLGKMDPEEKGAMTRRLMGQAHQHSWTQDKPGAPSSAGQYLAVYEEAMKRRFKRQKAVAYPLQDTVDRVTSSRFRALSPSDSSVRFMDRVESAYVKDWMLDRADAATYERHESLTHTFPNPYAQKVRSDLYREFGPQIDGSGSVSLRVPAPAASQVELIVYDKSGVEQKRSPLKKSADGVWSLSIQLPLGTLYRLNVNGQMKIDPFARELVRPDENQPPFCVIRAENYSWSDSHWMSTRKKKSRLLDARILELHPLTWRKDLKIEKWSDLAEPLIAHMKTCDFTHVELMAILSHPTIPSMGYTVSNYFATDERMGGPDELRKLIDALHRADIGVISDFVPGHCATEEWALGKFDGKACFEISGLQKLSIQALFFRWGHHMNLANPLTVDMLLSSLMMFAREFHIDGFRVDAIKSILAHYDPKAAAIFLRHLNSCLEQEFPECFTVAEDYSGNSQVVQHINANGMGFNGRWDIGWKETWMDVANMSTHKRKTAVAFEQIRNAMNAHLKSSGEVTYLSHDEFQSGQPSFVELGGCLTPSQRLNQAQVILAQQRLVPGPNLLFMGCETFSDERWSFDLPTTPAPKAKSLLSDAHKQAFYSGLKAARAHLGTIEKMTPIQCIGSGLQYRYELHGTKGSAIVEVNLTAQPLPIKTAKSSKLLFSTTHSTAASSSASAAMPPFSLRVFDLPKQHESDCDAISKKVKSV